MSLPKSQILGGTSAINRVRVQGIRYIYLLKKRWWVLVLLLSLGLCIGAWTAMQQPPAYLSSGRMMVAGQMRLSDNAAAYSEELMNFFGTQIELMQSTDVQKGAETRVRALHPDLPAEQVKVIVGQLPKAAIFVLNIYAKSPAYAQAYVEAMMEEYLAKKKELRELSGQNTAVAIEDQIVRLETTMKVEEDEMHQFQLKNNLGFMKEDGNSAASYLSILNRRLDELKTEFNLLQKLDLDQNLDRSPSAATAPDGQLGRMDSLAGSPGPLAEYLKVKQAINQLKADRQEFLLTLKPKHPSVVALDEQIAKNEANLGTYKQLSQDALVSRRNAIKTQIEGLEENIKIWEAKALDLAGRMADFDKIKSKIDRTKVHHDRLTNQLRTMDVYRNMPQDTVTVLEHATKPKQIQMELNKLLLIGGFGGLALGLLVLFVLDKMDDRIGSFFEFRERFPEPLLGQVPREITKVGVALLASNDPRHALLESFRTLRSSIIFLPVEGARPKTILVTSATPGEGKTTIAANLAITFAFSGARTLLVDADLRLGRVAKAFKIESEVGLSDVLRQRTHWREVIVPTSTPNLSILPRGKTLPHPAEHFLGKVTDQLLQEVYAEFDYIIFDSPPVMAADDVLSLAPKIDGTIFVVRFSTSSARRSRTAINLLVQRQANLLGIVCNDVRLAESEYGYGNYYQYSAYRENADAEPIEPLMR